MGWLLHKCAGDWRSFKVGKVQNTRDLTGLFVRLTGGKCKSN